MLDFRWYQLPIDVSPSVICGEDTTGIYILHFAAGDRYVGQAINIAKRITQHRHGGKHHTPWRDIDAIAFSPAERVNLDQLERETITWQRSLGFTLRNVTYNLETSAPRPIDHLLGLSLEDHWATGHDQYIASGNLPLPERRDSRVPRLLHNREAQQSLPDGRSVADAVIDDLAFTVANAIPNAPELEGEYWSITDSPSTSGGRFATLNVGNLELMYFPRRKFVLSYRYGSTGEYVTASNAPADQTGSVPSFIQKHQLPQIDPNFRVAISRCHYQLTETLQTLTPVGTLFSQPCDVQAETIRELRALVLPLMRRGRNTLFNRYHSKALTDCVYQRINQKYGSERN